jgi:hypothetical protein
MSDLSNGLDNYGIRVYNFRVSMRQNFPNYNRISEIEKELSELAPRLTMEKYYDEEAANKEHRLVEELLQLIMGERVEAEDKHCGEKHCGLAHDIYYPGKVHHLDGNTTNNSFDNLAMVCPKCHAHILLSRFTPKDIWLLKARGLSNAEIGRLLDLSRERVRQLGKKYEALQESEITYLEVNVDNLVKRAQDIDNSLKTGYSRDKDGFPIKWRRKKGKRLIDRRTLRKRIIAELDKLKAEQSQKEAQNERKYKTKKQK